jgi:predicted metalloprotease with PDZ domain
MRYLWTDYFKKGRNYTPQDYQKAAELMAGRSLDDFFSKYVRGTAEIDYDTIFKGIGLTLKPETPNDGKAYIGADLREDAGSSRLTVTSVVNGTPAYEEGLNAGDQIVAIDGYRATLARLQQYVGDKKPGDHVRLSIFRTDRLHDIDFTLGNNTRRTYSFEPVAKPTDQQRRLYHDYLGGDLQ